MRLNGWQRIGVVLSVVWALGAAYIVAVEYESFPSRERDYNFVEYEFKQNVSQGRRFGPRQRADVIESARFKPLNIAALVFAPIAAFWLVSGFLVWLYRWIRAGFIQSK